MEAYVTEILITIGVGVVAGHFIFMRKTMRQIEDLHDWHNVRDADGRFAWYVRQSLENSLDRLADAILAQTDVLRDLGYEVKHTREDVDKLMRD